MAMNKAFVALVALLCAGAGLGGVFLATRSSEPAAATKHEALVTSRAASGETPARPLAQPASEVSSRTPERPAPGPRPVVASQNASASPVAAAPVMPGPATGTRLTSGLPPERAEPVVAPPVEPAGVEPEPMRAPEPPASQFEELIVSADSVIGLQVETSLTSEGARVEDDVVARVTRDVRVGDRVAIPAGARAEGEVTLVERGGRLRERARLGVRFTSVVLADGTRVRLETDTVYREGTRPGGESAAKIGGSAIGGAILGGILGGAKGAIIGGSAGAGAGSAAVMAGGRNPATLPAGTPVTVRITRPATVIVEK